MGTVGDLFRLFHESGEELYFVGGFVRDTLLGKRTSDVDLATGALPERVMDLLASGGFKPIPIGLEFGTVGTHVLVNSIRTETQITTYRCQESYVTGSRHPSVIFGDSLTEDLKRRDFTVNAMAMDNHGNLIDPLGGRIDLEDRVLRTPAHPEETFREDPLRMLRAFRFACRLDFRLHGSIVEAISEHHGEILNISRERWKLEMDSLLSAPDGFVLSRTLDRMMKTGILQDMIPELAHISEMDAEWHGEAHRHSLWDHTLDVVRQLRPDPCLRWAGLLHDIGKIDTRSVDSSGKVHFYDHETIGTSKAERIAERFRFSRKERSCLLFLVRNHMRPVLFSSDWSDRAVRKLVRDSGEYLEKLLQLAAADISSHSPGISEEGLSCLKELGTRLSRLNPAVKKRVLPRELGEALLQRVGGDIRSAPDVGVILSNLEELVHSGVLPAMAPANLYIDYMMEHPEIRLPEC